MKFSRTISILLVIYAVYWSFTSLMPSYERDAKITTTDFSVDRAKAHVKNLSVEPHAVGFTGHANALAYVIGELKKLGFETTTQTGYTAGDWGNLSRATNVLARVKGSGQGKALLLMSHYDSSPHSSYGASDAASGVATILEGVRAFMETNRTPKNDIIILITDAEELGLNGADLFVNKHPWAKDVGLALNFEARGSGGASYMLIETNRGNGKLIKEFTEANPKYPVANSLAYSIYKMLPNDTDLTVFREDGDIEGFNFAFIDDHFDYHTALDTHSRLDNNSLAHQGSYLMPLLTHFSEANLNDLKSLNDYVYFNMPVFKMVSYPFEWIWPMFIIAVVLFILLLIMGFKRKSLSMRGTLMGFVPMLLTLIINGAFGYFGWSALKWWYPWYADILQGFTYNGHLYIMAFALFSLGVCFFIYNRLNKITTANLLAAPVFLWLLICGITAVHLKGASFFVIPLYGLLAAFMVNINQEKPNPLLLLFLALPAIFIFAPFIKMFPVGLGLKMMVASTLLTTLLYFLVLPLFALSKNKLSFSIICFFVYALVSINAHLKANYSDERPKPSSLLYVYDVDSNVAKWATYDNVLIDWNAQFLKQDDGALPMDNNKTISSKYGTGFTHTAKAPMKKVAPPEIIVTKDTVINEQRYVTVCATPNRPVNRLEVYTNKINLLGAQVNGIQLSEYYLKHRRNGKLITHYISDNDYTEMELVSHANDRLELTFYEASNDLLNNAQFSVPPRPTNSIPMPFVLNDAILVTQKLTFD